MAADYFQQALEKEDDYAAAYVGLAESWLLTPLYTSAKAMNTVPKARAAALSAIDLYPESARAYAVLGVLSSQYDWNWSVAQYYFSRAVALDPNDATAHQWKVEAHCYHMEFDLCRTHITTALALDPLSPILTMGQGLPDRFTGNWVEAERFFRVMIQQYPDFPYARYQLGLVLDAQAKWSEALEQFELLLPIFGERTIGASIARAYAETGREREARAIYDRLVELRRTEYVSPVVLASILLRLDDKNTVYDWLGIALEEKDDYLIYLSVAHDWRDMKCEARYDRVLHTVGLPACGS